MDITAAEFQYAEALGNNDGQIDRYEFMQMSLLRLGIVDLDLLDMINARFDEGGFGSLAPPQYTLWCRSGRWFNLLNYLGEADCERFRGQRRENTR